MTENSLIVLGSSSGLPQPNRANSGYILKVGSSCSLIDCGGGVTSSFLKTGLDPLSVDRIFISHAHSDHVCELTLFIQLIYLRGRTPELELYLPSEFVEVFYNYLDAVYLIKEKMPFAMKVIGYESGFEYSQDFSLKACPTRHLYKYKDLIDELKLPNRMQCHCFVIEVGDSKVLYSADIGSLNDIILHLDSCRYAIVESTHIDIDEFLLVAAEKKVGKYIITHLGSSDEVEVIRSKISKSGLKNVELAQDRLVLPI